MSLVPMSALSYEDLAAKLHVMDQDSMLIMKMAIMKWAGRPFIKIRLHGMQRLKYRQFVTADG